MGAEAVTDLDPAQYAQQVVTDMDLDRTGRPARGRRWEVRYPAGPVLHIRRGFRTRGSARRWQAVLMETGLVNQSRVMRTTTGEARP